MPGNPEEHPTAKKNAREALSNLYELTFSAWGPTGVTPTFYKNKIFVQIEVHIKL
jgi:hypothetical protein